MKLILFVWSWRVLMLDFLFSVLAVFFALGLVFKLYLIYDGLVSGVVIEASRSDPLSIHSLADEPWRYWLFIVLHLFGVGVSAVLLKLVLLGRTHVLVKYR